MKGWIVAMSLLLASSAVLADDWRKDASDDKKLENLIKVMPSTADIMMLAGERYGHLYWAGKQGKWEFAEYQMEEIVSLMEKLMITRPGRAATSKAFVEHGFTGMEEAIEKQDWARFEQAFEHMRNACFACHKQNDHAFITLPKRPAKSHSIALQD